MRREHAEGLDEAVSKEKEKEQEQERMKMSVNSEQEQQRMGENDNHLRVLYSLTLSDASSEMVVD